MIQRRFEAEASVDAYHNEIEHIGKDDSESLLQFRLPPRDVGVGTQHAEHDANRHYGELQIPFKAYQELLGQQISGCRQNDGYGHSCKNVIVHGIGTEKTCAHELAPQLRPYRTLHAETLFIEIGRDQRVETRCETRRRSGLTTKNGHAFLDANLNGEELADDKDGGRYRAKRKNRDQQGGKIGHG